MLKFEAILLIFCLSLVYADEDSETFFEVDITKLNSESPVKFGARIFLDHLNQYPDMIKQIGPIFQLAHWETLWEVSSAAPAPHEADDERMNMWIGSIYWNMAGDIEGLANTSRSMVEEGVQCIIAPSGPPNSYYNTPKNIIRFRERSAALKEGRVLEEEEWTIERAMKEKENEDPNEQYNQMMSDSVADFAKFWSLSVLKQHELNVTLPYIELTWEPDNKQRVFFLPEDYALTAKLVRQQLKEHGVPEEKNKIVGPGTSSSAAAKPYIEAIVKDREAYDSIFAWSVHVWDNGSSMEELEHQLLIFKQIIKATVPSSWPQKPVIVTSFGYHPAHNYAFGEVEFNGDMEHCYYKIMGRFQKAEDYLPNTISQSPVTSVRLLASLLLQYSYGYEQVIYEWLADTPWSHSCKGMFDREGRHKQIYVVFSTLLPYLSSGDPWDPDRATSTLTLQKKYLQNFRHSTGHTICDGQVASQENEASMQPPSFVSPNEQKYLNDFEDWNFVDVCKNMTKTKKFHLNFKGYFVPQDSLVVRKQWKNSNECYSAMFKSNKRVVVAVANPGSSPCMRSFSFSGIDDKKISEAFTLSYNNGTVSLAAEHPSEALVLKLPLLYDVFSSDEEDEKNVVEFDIGIGPYASATAVVDLTKVEEEPLVDETSKAVHSEL